MQTSASSAMTFSRLDKHGGGLAHGTPPLPLVNDTFAFPFAMPLVPAMTATSLIPPKRTRFCVDSPAVHEYPPPRWATWQVSSLESRGRWPIPRRPKGPFSSQLALASALHSAYELAIAVGAASASPSNGPLFGHPIRPLSTIPGATAYPVWNCPTTRRYLIDNGCCIARRRHGPRIAIWVRFLHRSTFRPCTIFQTPSSFPMRPMTFPTT